MNMLREFKKFLLRGNVVDLAVAVVIGTAFTAVVKALVDDLLTPIIALIFGKPTSAHLSFTINSSHFAYGDFINTLFTFVTVAAAMFFFVVTPMNMLMQAARAGGPGDQAVPGVHQRDPGRGEALPAVHDPARGRRGAGPRRRRRLSLRWPTRYSELSDSTALPVATEITRPRRPRVNSTVPAERA